MNGFFYIPLKPFRLPSPEPLVVPPENYPPVRRRTLTFGVDYRVVDVTAFKEKIALSRQDLKNRFIIQPMI